MAKNYGVLLPEPQVVEIVQSWRRANQWCVRFWSDLDQAARKAVRNPETEQSAGRVTYYFDGSTLWVVLPCGRPLAYPQAAFEAVKDWTEIGYLKAAWKPAAGAETWPRARLWPGLYAEGITQGVCASLLRHSLSQCDAIGLPCVLHVHDEIVLEVPDSEVESAKAQLRDIMTVPPDWASGFPLDVEITISKRYQK
jgi:DNA polymerase